MNICVICNSVIKNGKSKYCSGNCKTIGGHVDNEHPKINCETCGKEIWNRKDKITKFCSNKCRKTEITKFCVNCNGKFTCYKCRREEAKFCSKECYTQHQNKDKETKFCINCGNKIFNHSKKYCSITCCRHYRKIHSPKNLICIICGKKYITSLTDHQNSKYCSSECQHIGMIKRVNVTCGSCGKIFNVPKSHSNTKYCSRRCYLLNGVKKSRNQKSSMTNIEKVTYEYLIKLGLIENVDFVLEYPCGRMSVDFFFPYEMVGLETDGIYWHSVLGRTEADMQRDERILNYGITIVRFSESEIINELSTSVQEKLFPVLRNSLKNTVIG